MFAQAIQRILPPLAGARTALAPEWRVLLVSQAIVFAAAALGAAWLTQDSANAVRFDTPALSQPFGAALNDLLGPLAHWDALWYLEIAADGYDGGAETAFFPLYPLLVFLLGFGGSDEARLIAAYAVSLAALAGALTMLRRLVELELGPRYAAATLWLVALFPAAFYLGAPYSESLFLLVSIGAFYAARTGRWALAGALAALASATRSIGIVLLLPLLVLYLYPGGRPRVRVRPDVLWLGLAPLGLAAYTAYLALAHGDGFAYLGVQDVWHRDFAGPFAGVWDSAVAAFDGVRQLVSGSRDVVYWERAAADPVEVAWDNVIGFGFLAFAAVALAGTFRRLPPAYGLYALAALAVPLSFPVGPQPLMSLPRFLAVLFPLFMWLAVVTVERRLLGPALAVSGLLLVLFTAQFASWQWVF